MTSHRHTYDEHGQCFECDKPRPQPKAAIMARLRSDRVAAGLVRVELWLTQDQVIKVKQYVKEMQT